MQMVFFTIANTVVMFSLGNADGGLLLTIPNPALVPFVLVLAVALFMGLLSGSLIYDQKNREVWGAVHNASSVLPFAIGFQNFHAPMFLIGIVCMFLCGQLVIITVSNRSVVDV